MPSLVRSTPSLSSVSGAGSGDIKLSGSVACGMPVVPVGGHAYRLGKVNVEEHESSDECCDVAEDGDVSSSCGDVGSECSAVLCLGTGDELIHADIASVGDGGGERWEGEAGGGATLREELNDNRVLGFIALWVATCQAD